MLSEGALAELQRQLQLQNEQFAERLRHELPALGELAGEEARLSVEADEAENLVDAVGLRGGKTAGERRPDGARALE